MRPLRLRASGVPTRAALLALLAWPSPAFADPPLGDERATLAARLAEDPQDIEALLARSELSMRAREPAAALDDLRVAAALQAGDARVARQSASVLHRLGRDEEALAWLDSLDGRGRAEDARALGLRARVLSALGRSDEAIEAYDAAVGQADDVDLWLERGALLEQTGQTEAAARGYAEGAATTSAAVLQLAGIDLDLRTGRADRALQAIDALLPRMAARARGLLLRARALEALERPRDARSARLEALAELDARIARRASPALRVDRGEALLGLGRAPEALAEANAALARLPDFEPARSLAARARRVLGGAR